MVRKNMCKNCDLKNRSTNDKELEMNESSLAKLKTREINYRLVMFIFHEIPKRSYAYFLLRKHILS